MSEARELSAARRALLEQRLRGRGSERSVGAGIPRRPDRDGAPLSFAQRQVWVIDQMAPGTPAYNLPFGIRVRGPLDLGALEASVNAIVRRHEVLRTTFEVRDTGPVQRIHPELRIRIGITELADEPADRREQRLQRLATAAATQPFDLARLPLLRVSVFRLAAAEHVLLINLHHIIADGVSCSLFVQELDVHYRALTYGAGATPPLPLQYGDYAHWQRESLAGQPETAAQIEFWRRALAGAPPALELPVDRGRPSIQSFAGSNVFFTLPSDLVTRLRELGAAEGCTIFMTLLAAYQVLLFRYSSADDFVIGTPVVGRTAPETQPLIGNFLTVAALRCDLSGAPTFRDVLRRTRETSLDALSNAAVPLETVMQQMQIERTAGRNPVFQVLFQMLTGPEPRLADLEVSEFVFDLGFAQLDLSLHLYESAGGYCGRFEYCSDLFERPTAERIAANFARLLHAVVADPARAVTTLPVIADAERRLLLGAWNDTATEAPSCAVSELLATAAARYADRVAARFGEQAWTYAELDCRASEIASALAARGARPGERIGLCLERGLDMLAAVIGVLKTGAAYVPLDPAFPESRLRFMVDDAQLAGLVTTAALADVTGVPRTRQLLLDADSAAMGGAGAHGPSAASERPGPTDPAYLIFTSGSTGRPKGVIVPQRAVVNFLHTMASRPGLDASDVLVAVTTLSFDIAVLELLLPLTVGATVVIASREQAMDGEALRVLLAGSRASAMQATPVTWRLLLEAGWAGSPGFKALVGGEALPRDLAEALVAGGVELWNMYGPTETTVWSTCARIDDPTHGITIGQPIANTTVRVLDGHHALCPVGVAGELYIGGAGVATGYWRRPELTAERFIADPFSAAPGALVYRTGDRVRWRADGSLEHLGRLDDQVKVRGFRIDLGDVEVNLTRHPSVREAAVAAQENGSGERRLVAYLVPAKSSDDPRAEVRDHLLTLLPDYMVPSHFVLLEALPRTQNGKLDRGALPAPALNAAAPAARAVAPRTATEALVMDVFREVLGRTDFGVFETFFNLGGDSLMAARMVLRLRTASGRDLPLRVLFERQSVAAMSEAIDALSWVASSAEPPRDGGDRVRFEL